MAVLGDATDALSRLDVEGLEALHVRALALQAELRTDFWAGSASRALPELTARLRVFAKVLEATGRDVRVLSVGRRDAERDRMSVWAH